MKGIVLAVAICYRPVRHTRSSASANHEACRTGGEFSEINISERRARIGEAERELIDRFGIYHPAYEIRPLVGTVLAQASSRPSLDWKFIVVDSEGVNAYAAPGGIVHITEGRARAHQERIGACRRPRARAADVTEKHTIKAIQKSKMVDVGTDVAGAEGGIAGSVLTWRPMPVTTCCSRTSSIGTTRTRRTGSVLW